MSHLNSVTSLEVCWQKHTNAKREASAAGALHQHEVNSLDRARQECHSTRDSNRGSTKSLNEDIARAVLNIKQVKAASADEWKEATQEDRETISSRTAERRKLLEKTITAHDTVTRRTLRMVEMRATFQLAKLESRKAFSELKAMLVKTAGISEVWAFDGTFTPLDDTGYRIEWGDKHRPSSPDYGCCRVFRDGRVDHLRIPRHRRVA